jgi:hypothetical protein
MVGGDSFTVGFEGDEPWSRPVKLKSVVKAHGEFDFPLI